MPPVIRRLGIPVTDALSTLVDLAATTPIRQLEAAVSEADKLGLVRADTVRADLDALPRRRGLGKLKRLLDVHASTDSDLERVFLRIVRQAGLSMPRTQVELIGYRVDFFWPELGLVVETDGLTYHRTAGQQSRDRRRDQDLTAAGLTCLRFTNAQVRSEAAAVIATLRAVTNRRLNG
jgi:very-short-patch-repair endonuclease